MSKFAQYFVTYRNDNLFAQLEWDKREDLLADYLANEDSIQFADKSQSEGEVKEGDNDEPKQQVKIYRHKIYHLEANRRIIVMRIANVKIIPIERDFKPESVEHYPSVFVIFDMRAGCRRVAIQKLSSSFSSTDQVAKILQKTLGDQMEVNHHIGLEMRAQRYPMDFYRLWRTQEHHTARLKFNLDPEALRESSKFQDSSSKSNETWNLKPETSDEQGVMGYIYALEASSRQSGYRTALDVEPVKKGAVMMVDESSTYIRSLVNYSAATGTTIELITNDGGSFECYINTDMMSDDKIVCVEFETAPLEALFDSTLEADARKSAEMKVVEFVNGMKHVVDDKEQEVERW